MKSCGLSCLAAMAFAVAACAGRPVSPNAPAHGNLLALAAQQGDRETKKQTRVVRAPLVVLVERHGLRAVDPKSSDQRWAVRLRVHGHPVAGLDTIYVPVGGHRLVALDRWTGQQRWEAPLPGEAVTGMDVSEPFIVVSVIDHRKGRSRLAGLSTHDGQLRWLRRSQERFGVPAAAGNLALVSHGGQVIGFSVVTGFEKARIDLPRGDDTPQVGAPHLERVALDRKSVLAGQGAQWVDLGTSIGGRIEGIQTVDDEYAEVFRRVDGLDPGHADAERLHLWVQFASSAEAPRAAVLLCRRSVVAMRLSPKGRAAVAQWAHLAPGGLEYVAMKVAPTIVTLVREDGQIVSLDRTTGVVKQRVAGGEAVRGALILGDVGQSRSGGRAPKTAAVRGMLVNLVDDPDPRLLPAQRLALDLLWRDEEPAARDVVLAIAESRRRTQTNKAASVLRQYALDRVAGPWGRPDMPERAGMDSALATRPSFLADRRPAVAVLARQAVASGGADSVPQLVEHLLHPATGAADLDEIVVALARLRRPEAVAGVAEFVRRYHADPQVIHESAAVVRAVDLLLQEAGAPGGAPGGPPRGEDRGVRSKTAREVLEAAVADPFTEPALRAYIAPRLAALPRDDEPDQGQDHDAERPPRLTALSDPSL